MTRRFFPSYPPPLGRLRKKLNHLSSRAPRRIWFFVLALLLTGCKVGPNYKRPPVDIPGGYRGLAPGTDQQTAASLGDEKWWTVFQDEQLQKLIRQALANNYDVRIAAVHVLEAQASLGITRSNQFPTITGGAAAVDLRNPQTKLSPAYNTSANQLDLSLFWQLDFWGQYRRATEAARATLLATEWGKRAVITTLVSNVATAYFQLLALDLSMEISKETLDARKESLNLVEIREKGGVTSLLDVRQSEELLYTATSQISDLERQIAQQEDYISILLGQNPAPIVRGKPLVENKILPTLPAGLPSSLLERRPDLQSAEQQLVAANAQIGVAKAAFFPQIALTAEGGYQSSALTSLFTGPAGLWNFGGQLTQPIFTGGKLRSNLRLTEAQKQEAILVYQQSIQEAFREVSDALVAYRKNQETREQQALLTAAAVDSTRLARVRYEGGVASYLEVLDTDTLSFNAQLSLAQAELNERLALVQLYTALGGGWQE